MSLESDLKEAFERRAGDVYLAPGAWTRIEARVRRGYRMRLMGLILAAVAVVAGSVVAIPRLIDRADRRAITVSGGPAGPEGWTTFRDESRQFQIKHPQDW